MLLTFTFPNTSIEITPSIMNGNFTVKHMAGIYDTGPRPPWSTFLAHHSRYPNGLSFTASLSALLLITLRRAKNGALNPPLPSITSCIHPPLWSPPRVTIPNDPLLPRRMAVLPNSGCLTEHIGPLGYIRQKFTVPRTHYVDTRL